MQNNDHHVIYEAARKRAKEKRGLYYHFLLFLVGSLFFVILNKTLNVYPEKDWYFWAIMIWLFVLVMHVLRIFVFKPMFGEEWLRRETDKLMARHNQKVKELENKLEKEGAFNNIPSSEIKK